MSVHNRSEENDISTMPTTTNELNFLTEQRSHQQIDSKAGGKLERAISFTSRRSTQMVSKVSQHFEEDPDGEFDDHHD